MKKSIALLAVLGFIIVLLSLSTLLFSIYDKYSQSSYKYISQDRLLISSVTTTLKKYIKNHTDIYDILTTFPLQKPNMIITVSPILNKININNYLENNKTNQHIDDVLNNILSYYQVLDPLFFKNILLDTIDTDTIDRDDSEIILSNPNFQNGLIYNKKHFKEILDYYAKKTQDTSIYKIPWDKYIFFGDKKHYILDCNLLDPQLAKFLGIENDIISCNNIDNKIKQAFNMQSFDKNKTYLIKININDMDIIYDTKTGGYSIEKHFIY